MWDLKFMSPVYKKKKKNVVQRKTTDIDKYHHPNFMFSATQFSSISFPLSYKICLWGIEM